ncbi:magnesium-translocating P-type ATPase [Candidatus Saccharibacteria bacterium]|nr:magnesium-translocating P-type ATPase [Candidatus Saccharibacteria bacterium]
MENASDLGLTLAEAAKRLDKYGPNTVIKERKMTGIRAYLSRFRNPLVIILILAALLAGFFGEVPSMVIIMIIVLMSVTLDFVNTYRSEKAADRLQKKVRVFAQVWRSHKIRNVALADIVPGDIIELDAGSLIPADGEIIAATDLTLDESSLTGESFPALKNIDETIYLGSSVTSGAGTMRVTATGAQTQFARIAAALRKTTPTEFDIEIKRFSMLIARLTFGLVLMIFALNVLLGHNALIDALLFSIALAIGLTPELLPLIITLNLTKGSLAMAKKGVIVKKLSAIQNFGSMDVLCTDKTGTLTENRIIVARTENFAGTDDEVALQYAYTACKFSTAYENPLDAAILKYRKFSMKGYKLVQEIPFDFQRKRESVVVKTGGHEVLISKGAPDEMLKIVNSYEDNGKNKVMTDAALGKLTKHYETLSRDGFRVLAIATKNMTKGDKDGDYSTADETDLVFAGFIAFVDPPKGSAEKSLLALRDNGIEVKIITGDDPLVAAKVADDLKLEVKSIVTGDEIAKMNRLKLEKLVDDVTIFARVNPEQKLKVIEALRARGHVVGYLGDGINDAPSLRAADIGISVNNAVDIAKDTADLILMNESLAMLNAGVIEGRRTFANTLKYLMMSLSSNFGNMFSMAGASLFLPFLPMTAPQILFNNLLYDASQMAIPTDTVDKEMIAKPRRMDLKSIKKFMWVFGPLSSVFDFITFGTLFLVFHLGASEFQTGWFIESMLTQTFVVYIIRTRRLPFIHSRPSWPLMLSVLAVCTIAVAVVFSSLGPFFGFTTPSMPVMISISLIVLTYLVAAEIAKQVFYKKVQL